MRVASSEIGPLTLVSPDASGDPYASYLINSGERNLTVTNRGWNPTADATSDCVRRSPAWYRVDDLTGNWRYRLLILSPLAAIAAAVLGLVGPRRSRRGAASVGVTLTMANAVLYVLVWVTHSV